MTISSKELVKAILERHERVVKDPSVSREEFTEMSKEHLYKKCRPHCRFCEIDREIFAIFHLDRIGLKVEGVDSDE